MRIVIETIPEDGVDVDVQLDMSWAADVASNVLESEPESLEGHLHVDKRDRLVRVRGSVRAAGERVCERCGETTTLTLGGDVDLAYVPASDAPSGHGEIRLDPGDLDVGWYSEGSLDLADVLSEALALDLPPRVACTDTESCDQRVAALLDAANGSPDGDAEASDSPFAALRQLT